MFLAEREKNPYVQRDILDGEYDRSTLFLAAQESLDVAETQRDREGDRWLFPNPEFNRWLDEPITENGEFTVWHQIDSICDAWHGFVAGKQASMPPQDFMQDLFSTPPLAGVIGHAQRWVGPNGEVTHTFDVSRDDAIGRYEPEGWRKDGDVFPVKDATL